MRACEAVYDMRTSEKVQALIEEATGKPCPCTGGLPCPLLSMSVKLVPKLCVDRWQGPPSQKERARMPSAR